MIEVVIILCALCLLDDIRLAIRQRNRSFPADRRFSRRRVVGSVEETF